MMLAKWCRLYWLSLLAATLLPQSVLLAGDKACSIPQLFSGHNATSRLFLEKYYKRNPVVIRGSLQAEYRDSSNATLQNKYRPLLWQTFAREHPTLPLLEVDATGTAQKGGSSLL